VLAAGLALGAAPAIPVAVALAGGAYGAGLAIDARPLDPHAAFVAATLLLAAETGYWSLELRSGGAGGPGSGSRRVALLALYALAALVLGAALVAAADLVRVGSPAAETAGALAAAAVLALVAVLARAPR
jgi:hypothetical protein